MRKLTLCLLACCAVAASSYAQDVPVNREKYPDYVDPRKAYPSEPRLMKFVPQEGEAESRAASTTKLPEYWNNADTKYFPPVFNQDGGSCGSASRICYMFTHEINALRDLDASLPENQYPSHFVWLLTSGNSGKDHFVEYVGVPNVATYGGRTYSSLFGYQEETNNYFGWMTGYDKWMNAIGNRMLRPTSNPLTVDTKEGRLAAKAWLYNHAGDGDFKTGGLIGLGVASGGVWHEIPYTEANKAAGVNGKYYVHRWGTQVDHAVTMVGWDDRIEFDLDGNGIAGEVSKDEKGAWIIVNSWGNWCNEGFIYCPYKYAGPVSDQKTGAMTGGYWSGELYHARKNFRPTRVIKLKMDYTHRSEMLLQVGISSDLNATEPESVMDMHHFRYAGDGNNGNTDPAPAIPMLGKWGSKWNEAPMEFCYDMTDFSAGFDQNKPLKYFFIINRKKEANKGSGKIYEASILDMEHNLTGIESQFDLGGETFEITKEGKKLMISTIVYGPGYEPVNNLSYADGLLTWNVPNKCSYTVASYNIYKNGVLVDNTKETTYSTEAADEFAVTAVYENGTESSKVVCTAAIQQNNVAMEVENAGFTIPNVFQNHYKDCTIEFWINPSQFKNWNNSAGPGWGTFMQHFNSDGRFTYGWDTGARANSNQPFVAGTWTHVALVIQGGKMTLYRNAVKDASVSTKNYSGIGGFGDYVFASSGNSAQNAKYDEIRIWDHARSEAQIKGSTIKVRRQEFFGNVMPQGLLAYYKGDVFEGADGKFYLRDCIAGNHAQIHNVSANPQVSPSLALVETNIAAKLSIDPAENVYAGVPVTLRATYTEAINDLYWTIPACGIEGKRLISPTVVFDEVGTYEVSVRGINYKGKEYTDTVQVEVAAAPALDASFTMSHDVLPCGDNVSLNVNNYAAACSYEWILPGADEEKQYGAKAAASYEAPGEYIVTLKVTAADGRTAESSDTITTTSVAPKADFNVVKPFVVKGTYTEFQSTSRYGATDFEWILDSKAQKVTIQEGNANQAWKPTYPGKYDITLKASNSLGESTITKAAALTVLNDDSKNGLSFSKSTSKVEVPVGKTLTEFTIEFWANPSSVDNACWGIGDAEGKLQFKVEERGAMSVTINGVTVSTNEGYVIPGEWNHYAVRRNTAGTLVFFRNAERFATINTDVNKDAIESLASISMGQGAPMNGAIDEFRFWTTAYAGVSGASATCNAHLTGIAEHVSTNGLLVYYDFDQTGGNVLDRTGNGNNGSRSGFGPDGDSWGLSLGVFSLYLGDKQAPAVITGIEDLEQSQVIPAGMKGVYTLSGQYVGATVQGLPAGMYIVDGEKVVVK